MSSFKDALDYIFITNDSGSNSYLISDSIAPDRVTSAIATESAATITTAAITATTTATATATTTNTAAAAVTATVTATTTTTTTASATAAAAAVSSSTKRALTAAAAALMADDTAMMTEHYNAGGGSAVAIAGATYATDNLYSGVAVGLGAMLINDTLLLDVNGTNGFDVNETLLNKSGLISANELGNTTSPEDVTKLIKMAATSVILGLMILITIVGNVFVIAAIILERNLQNVANYLVASLAVADLFVACLVMPLGAVYEISDGWILGPELCDIWTSCDVLCCTASILHLVAIAVDRYWAVTNIDYIHSRTSRRVFLMIFCVWSAAVIVSLAPQFGWKDPDYLQRIEQQKCMVSQDVSYQVFATCCTFYVPLLVILVLYWKIYQTARKRIHRRRPKPIDVTAANNNQPTVATRKKRKRLRLRIRKFSGEKSNAGTTLGLVDGNSTNTVNTVEDTEFSSSNVDSKSRAGVEATTAFSYPEEQVPTTSASQITTVSHLVALANQQHQTTSNSSKAPTQPSSNANDLEKPMAAVETTASVLDEKTKAATTTTASTCIATTPSANNGNIATTTPTTNMGGAEVLADPHLQQQLEQVQQEAESGVTAAFKKNGGAGGGTSASNATTITSISALSPQTPTSATLGTTPGSNIGTTLAACASQQQQQQQQLQQQQSHPLSGSNNASNQVTPIPKPKNQQQLSSIPNPMHKVTKRKETLEAKRERKAAKTLAIITGAFVICWLPFFVMALLLSLCEDCRISKTFESLFLWLGYFNSTLNPVIYTIFSPEFRQAFKRILFGGHRPVHYRSGNI